MLANNIQQYDCHISLLNNNVNSRVPAAMTTQLEFSVWDERFFFVDILSKCDDFTVKTTVT